MENASPREIYSQLNLQPRFNKGSSRTSYIKLCAEKGLVGNSFWLAGDSTEIIEYLESTKADPSTVWNCEVDPILHSNVFDFYATDLGCHMAPRNYRLHQLVDMMPGPIVYGHADFIGLVGSVGSNCTSTFTYKLIDSLSTKLGDEAYLAFTHSLSRRNATSVVQRWVTYHRLFQNKFNAKDLRESHKAHPSMLISQYMALVFGGSYNISVESSFDYPSSQNGTKGGNWMNKTVIHLSKGELDVESMLHSVYAHETLCKSIKDKLKGNLSK